MGAQRKIKREIQQAQMPEQPKAKRAAKATATPPPPSLRDKMAKEGKLVKPSNEVVNSFAELDRQMKEYQTRAQSIQNQWNAICLQEMAERGLKPSEWEFNSELVGFVRKERKIGGTSKAKAKK